MKHRKGNKQLNRNQAARSALLRTQAVSLITHGKIKTTEAKAKYLKSFCEKMITVAIDGDLSSRRSLLKKLHDESAVKTLIDNVAPMFKGRSGGYTRIVRLGQRHGDAAPIVQLEIIQEDKK